MPGVLITGVSGIGGAVAQQALEKGMTVFAVDRDGKALDALPESVTKINADIGTAAGVEAIKAKVGAAPIHYAFFAAAAPANQDGKGHPLGSVTRANFEDMMNTDVHGKLFVVQALQENLAAAKAEGKTPRCFNFGAPFADGPNPAGKWMAIPGWGGFGAAKAANKYLWEAMKVDCKDWALFGYGHPGFTKTSLTQEVADNYDESMMMNKMCKGRIAKGDFHEPSDAAKLFWTVMEKSSDEDFEGKTWAINAMVAAFPDVEVKQTSDITAGIVIKAE